MAQEAKNDDPSKVKKLQWWNVMGKNRINVGSAFGLYSVTRANND